MSTGLMLPKRHETQQLQAFAYLILHWGGCEGESVGLRLTACSQEIRQLLPQLQKGMVRYNNPYDLYLKRTLPRC